MMKKWICFLLIFSFINAHSQDSTSQQKRIIYKSWPGYKLNGRMIKEKELKAEIYKCPLQYLITKKLILAKSLACR